MNSSNSTGNIDPGTSGVCPAPPPPPPPPIVGQVPALRINTAEIPGSTRPRASSDLYEPPVAIQNAMMTKDKKPFTYTPGMGGKLDLSQIRSPRMARRVAKNANDEGIEGPPKSTLETKSTPIQSGSVNFFSQPQVAIPVFPSNIPSSSTVNRTPNIQINRVSPSVPERHSSVQDQSRLLMKVETKMTPVTNTSQPNSPETPTTPPQVTLVKAPTPWLLNKSKAQDELPEWAKRSSANTPPECSAECPPSPSIHVQVHQEKPLQQTQPKQLVKNRQAQQQQQPEGLIEQMVSLEIEKRPSVFSVKQEPGHHQLQNTQPDHQSRWLKQSQRSHSQNQLQSSPVRQENKQVEGGYLIPIMLESASNNNISNGTPISFQPQIKIVPTGNQAPKIDAHYEASPIETHQSEPGPLQSRSFRVLQKITDTDVDNVDGDLLRKMQLTEDDKFLMNKFKEQVDGDTYLHQEADPRYRGATIPSRAFRYLQNITDSGDITTAAVPRATNPAIKKTNRNSESYEEIQANIPPSEQTVQEPKKYTGSAIPSRSFKILQAMTAPENIGPDTTDY